MYVDSIVGETVNVSISGNGRDSITCQKSSLVKQSWAAIGLPVTATGGVVPCGSTAIWESAE